MKDQWASAPVEVVAIEASPSSSGAPGAVMTQAWAPALAVVGAIAVSPCSPGARWEW